MRPSKQLVAASLVSAAIAAPPANGFSVETLSNPSSKQMSVREMYIRDLKRYGLSTAGVETFSPTGVINGTEPITNTPQDAEYYGTIYVGGQPVRVLFDTGSSDDWVFGPAVTAKSKAGRDIYSPSVSTRQLPGNWSIRYGDGTSATGKLYSDSLKIGPVTVADASIEVAESVSENIESLPVSGILGLGFPILNSAKPKQTNWVFKAKSSLREPVFCAALKRAAPGSFDFGFIDSTKHTGKISYIPLTKAAFWGFNSLQGRVGNSSLFGSTKPRPAIADSGTQLMYAFPEITDGYYRQIPGANSINGMWAYPCNATLPDLQLQVGSVWVTVKGPQFASFSLEADNQCAGLLQSFPDDASEQIFGGPFYKSLYIVHDMDKERIGFANQA